MKKQKQMLTMLLLIAVLGTALFIFQTGGGNGIDPEPTATPTGMPTESPIFPTPTPTPTPTASSTPSSDTPQAEIWPSLYVTDTSGSHYGVEPSNHYLALSITAWNGVASRWSTVSNVQNNIYMKLLMPSEQTATSWTVTWKETITVNNVVLNNGVETVGTAIGTIVSTTLTQSGTNVNGNIYVVGATISGTGLKNFLTEAGFTVPSGQGRMCYYVIKLSDINVSVTTNTGMTYYLTGSAIENPNCTLAWYILVD
jgi:hypothetical protein